MASLPRGDLAPSRRTQRPECPGSRINAPLSLPTAYAVVAVTRAAPRSQWRDRVGLAPTSSTADDGRVHITTVRRARQAARDWRGQARRDARLATRRPGPGPRQACPGPPRWVGGGW